MIARLHRSDPGIQGFLRKLGEPTVSLVIPKVALSERKRSGARRCLRGWGGGEMMGKAKERG